MIELVNIVVLGEFLCALLGFQRFLLLLACYRVRGLVQWIMHGALRLIIVINVTVY